MNATRVRSALLLAALLALGGCEDSGGGGPVRPGTPTPSSQFTGTFLSGSEAGILTVSIPLAPLARPLRSGSAADTIVSAFGTMSVEGGEVVNLTGPYDAETDSLHLEGQGRTLDGRYERTAIPPVLEGAYTGPNGPGSFGCWPGTASSVTVICGRFQGIGNPAAGRWNLAMHEGAVLGIMAPDGAGNTLGFSGTVTGNGSIRSISFSSGWTEPLLAGSGTWNSLTNRAEGTWTYGDEVGSWSGEPCLPGTAGSN